MNFANVVIESERSCDASLFFCLCIPSFVITLFSYIILWQSSKYAYGSLLFVRKRKKKKKKDRKSYRSVHSKPRYGPNSSQTAELR